MQTGSFTHTHTWVIRLSGREMCYKHSAAAAGRQTTCAHVICKRNAVLVAKGSLRLQKTTPRVLIKGRENKRGGGRREDNGGCETARSSWSLLETVSAPGIKKRVDRLWPEDKKCQWKKTRPKNKLMLTK